MKPENIINQSEDIYRNKEEEVPVESSESFGIALAGKAQAEVEGFEKAGQQGLTSLEERADSAGLSIDESDRAGLSKLNDEAVLVKNNLIEELNKEKQEPALENQNGKKETREFSKRYSSFRRTEVASQIMQARSEYRQKKRETEAGNLETQKKRDELGGEAEQIRIKVANLEKTVADYEEIVREQKSKLWFKFTSYFKKQEVGEEKILEIAKSKLEQTENELAEKEIMLGDLKEVIFDSSAMEDSRKMLNDFYAEQSEIKSKFESEREIRDVTNISKEKGVVFVHALPLDNAFMHNTSVNNEVIDAGKVDAMAKIKMILGLEPTISTSTMNEASNVGKGMMYPFGLILNGGSVVSANKGDAFTKTIGMYARVPKDDKSFKDSIIQNDISANIDDAINNASIASRQGGMSDQGYNEIVVENPKSSALYIDLDNKGHPIDLNKVKEISEQLNLPVAGLKDGKYFDLINGGKELSHEEVLTLGEELSTDEKLAIAESSLDTLFPGHEEKSIPLEVKNKIEEMQKNTTQGADEKKREILSSDSINLLDAKKINLRYKISYWINKKSSTQNFDSGNDLVEMAKKEIKGESLAEIEALCTGKTKEECLLMIRKFSDDQEYLDKFIPQRSHYITY